jgi:outer membrane receptor protein involved in Fe transport
VDFQLSKHHTLGVNINGSFSDGSNDSRSTNEIRDDASDSLMSILVSNTTNPFSRDYATGNLNYRFDNTKGTTFSTDFDYGRYRNKSETYQPNQYKDPNTEVVTLERIYSFNAPTDIDIYSWKADFEKPFLKGKLGSGVKTAYVQTHNTFDFYNVISGVTALDTTRSNQFAYTENVNAAYLNYQRQLKKWALQAGLRGEQTNSLGELTALVATANNRVERHYFNLFPSAGLTYNLTQKQTLRLSYSRRIDRPRYEDLNPFENKIDELSYRVGNPFLRPQYTHNIELAHSAFYTLNTSVSYSITSDYFTNLTDTAEGNRTYLTMANLSNRKVATFAISYPWSPFKWWSTFTNASVFNTTNNADFGVGKEISLSVTSFSVYHQTTFTLKHGTGIQLSGFYNSPGIWGANFRNRRFIGVDVGVTKKVFEGRGMFKAGLSDVFFTMQWRGVQEFGGLYMVANGGWESRQIKASYTHTFGNTQMKAARKRTTASEEEAKRAGGGGGAPGQ